MKVKKNKSLLPIYIKGLVSGKYTLGQVSVSTGYSKNWLCVLKHKYLREGFAFLERPSMRVPKNKTSVELCQKIADIYASDFVDVNFKYFQKCLVEFYDIKLSYPTLSKILKEHGLFSPEARKIKKRAKSKRPRLRRECEGDMIQIDGTPYAWFYKFGDLNRYCLVGAIDDATSKITGLYITQYECLYGYLEILRQTCKNYGVPREIYSDRAAIFCVTPKRGQQMDKWEQLSVLHGKNTQWQRVLDELSINQILTWSPEAKGRIERMWHTIQGQLPMWLKLHGYSTVKKANAHLDEYIAEFNNAYSVLPKINAPYWINSPQNLNHILQARFSRRTDNVGVFSFHGYKFVLQSPYASYRNFELCISEQGIYGFLDDKYYPVRYLDLPLDGLGETMSQVLKNLIFRYLFSYAKEISA